MRILHVVGARPNFMKAAPVIRALRHLDAVRQELVHTGQHYDALMSESFFEQLQLPRPDLNLGVGSGSHAQQTAGIMVGLEAHLSASRPDLLMVYGDVNSTLAASLVASKLGIRHAHVEAGLRSGDRRMPEEINRLVVDRLADLLFTPSEDAVANLLGEGANAESIHDVGNVMIDSLVSLLPMADAQRSREKVGLAPDEAFVLVTLHRPSNVDDDQRLTQLIEVLRGLTARAAVVFPVHPRTQHRLNAAGIDCGCIRVCQPLGYLDFLALQRDARLVITDSGGIQEETTYLGVQCLTVRESTERPVTVTLGTNTLVGNDLRTLGRLAHAALDGNVKRGTIPPRWDGRAAERIREVVATLR